MTVKQAFLRQPPEQAVILYDQSDVKLALANSTFLAISSMASASWSYLSSLALVIPLFVSQWWQRGESFQRMNHPFSEGIDTVLALAQFPALYLQQHELFNKGHSVSLLAGVTATSLPRLYTCVKNLPQKPKQALTGIALHSLNLFTQAYLTLQAFQPLSLYRAVAQVACHATKPSAEYAKMPPIQRLTELNPACRQDAVEILQIKDLEGPNRCKDIGRAFRKISPFVHPDRGGTEAAQINLNLARDTLNRALGCNPTPLSP